MGTRQDRIEEALQRFFRSEGYGVRGNESGEPCIRINGFSSRPIPIYKIAEAIDRELD